MTGRCLKVNSFSSAKWVGNLHLTPLPIKTNRRHNLRRSSFSCFRGLPSPLPPECSRWHREKVETYSQLNKSSFSKDNSSSFVARKSNSALATKCSPIPWHQEGEEDEGGEEMGADEGEAEEEATLFSPVALDVTDFHRRYGTPTAIPKKATTGQ